MFATQLSVLRSPLDHYHQPRSRSNQLRKVSAINDPDAASSPPPSPGRRNVLLSGLSIGSIHAMAVRGVSPNTAFAADTILPPSSSTKTLVRQLEQRVSEFTLSNGMRFIVSQRNGTAPILSCHTYANVGAFDEPDGLTGMAHLLEHLAFKGTVNIGTTNYQKEAELLDAIDEVFYSILQVDSGREVARLTERLESLQAAAVQYSVPNAFGSILQREGAVGLNAVTSQDATKYFCSLPSNKLELWFAMEAERFRFPVFREIYSEKKVVTEERKMRVDNAALGPFQEAFAEHSFGNNYKRPVIGYQRDIDRIGRREIQQFFTERYGPRSLTISIAGDVKPETVRLFAERYFGSWEQSSSYTPSAACGTNTVTGEFKSIGGVAVQEESLAIPSNNTVRKYESRSRAGPAVLRAFYRPCVNSEDSLPLEVASDILSGSRLSRLYRNLVLQNKALTATTYSSLPGEKHPCQFLMYGIPKNGDTAENVDRAMLNEIEQLASKGPTQEELNRVIKASKMSLLNVLTSNSTLAGALASYSALTGSWRNVNVELQRLDELTVDDVKAAAGKYLTEENSFVGYVRKI